MGIDEEQGQYYIAKKLFLDLEPLENVTSDDLRSPYGACLQSLSRRQFELTRQKRKRRIGSSRMPRTKGDEKLESGCGPAALYIQYSTIPPVLSKHLFDRCHGGWHLVPAGCVRYLFYVLVSSPRRADLFQVIKDGNLERNATPSGYKEFHKNRTGSHQIDCVRQLFDPTVQVRTQL